MNKEEERIKLNINGLTCDNTECDYQNDVPFEEYQDWLNKPCPKCGENLLTQEDLDTTTELIELTKLFNDISDEDFTNFTKGLSEKSKTNEEFCEENNLPPGTERVSIKLKVHNGVQIESIAPTKKE